MVVLSDAWHRAVLDAAPDALLGTDAQYRILFVNRRAEQLFGYNRTELHMQPLGMLLPLDPASLGPTVGRSERSRVRPRTELIAHRRDESEFAAEVTLSTYEAADGPITLVSIRERGERRPPLAEVRRLLEAAPDATVIVDGDGLITRANSLLETLFGYDRAALIGQPIEMLVVDAAAALCPEQNRPSGLPGVVPTGWRGELIGRRSDGSEFPAELSAMVFDSFGGPLVTATIRDVTDRVESMLDRERLAALVEQDQLRAQLAQSQRLESLGQLAGGIAHDFNNLLGVIQNYAAFVGETLSARVAERPSDARLAEARVDVEQIQSAAGRAARLARRLLAFARRETIEPEALDLNLLVRDIERLLTRTIGEHVSLVTELDPLLAPIEADRGQIEQIIVNLAVNARDAMPGGGTLTIKTAMFMVDEDNAEQHPALEPGPHVRLRVRDTGTGMSPEVLERAFDPFFTTKPEGEGSGLGLATVYGIVSQSNGSIRIASAPGAGTTVTVLWRPATTAVLDQPEAEPAQHAPGGETVLVVEDQPSLREVARRILARNGYRVLVASSGAEALKIVADGEHRVGLLLTDVVMPVMDGYELARQFAEVCPRIPVLFMSGYAEPVVAGGEPLAPPSVLVTKPFVESALLDAIRQALPTPSATAS